MNLLSKSTSQNPNQVKILFYGQSITRGLWWKQIEEDLKKRYPYADIEVKNLAIGGFAAQRLVLNTERDLLSFYPDLIIFHVYGDHIQYEQIILKMRTLTTADIAIQTDHYNRDSNPYQSDQGWTAFMNGRFLPKVAQRYLCELIDIRSAWRQYLIDNSYQPSKLLIDRVHLNEQGNFLMAQLIKPYLISNDKSVDDWPERVKTYQIGQDINFKDGKLNLEFVGNRIDAIVGEGEDIKAEVLIDGKHPSEISDLYRFTRANETSSKDWPWDVAAPFLISWEKPPIDEDWTLIIEDVNSIEQEEKKELNFTFSVTGSKTGADGQGSNTEKFVSNSGRVVIEPFSWILSSRYPSPIKSGYTLKFKSLLLGTDVYEAPTIKDNNHELTITLAQGLKNTKHHLQLIPNKKGLVPIKAIRVYRPPLNETNIKKPLVADEVIPSSQENE
ncbi:SGNH/GDSL hydrolase family protein [Gloeothece citriformis]|nr:hypothetical protein [Gloeothece citriformis]